MQINLNILTENNHSSLLSKMFQRLITHFYNICKSHAGTNNADTEDKKQQKLQHIVNKLKHGKN